MAYDLSYPSVTALLHFYGANGSTTFTDNSPVPKTFTRVADAVISTAQSVFVGGSSGYFDGTGDYLQATISSAIGTGDCCIEAAIRLASTASDYEIVCIGNIANSSQFDLVFEVNAGGALRGSLQNGSGGSQLDIITATGLLTAGTWHRVAFSVSGTTGRLFIDGTQRQSGTVSGTRVQSRTDLRIGHLAPAAPRFFNGHIGELRITNGNARRTADYTVDSEAFPNTGSEIATVSVTAPPARLESCYCGANASLTAPRPLFYAGPEAHATLALLAPRPTLGFHTGANPLLTAPSPALSFLTHDSTGEQAAYLTAPSPTLVCRTGAKAILTAPSPAITAGMTITNFARVDATAPSPALDSSVTVSETSSFDLTAPSPNLIGYGGAVCSVQITGRPQLVASATVGSVASFSLTCPLFELTASASADNIASFDLIAPSPEPGRMAQAWLVAPMARLTAIGTATITATYEAYAVNLKHSDPNASDETTRYTNFPFTHVVRYKNSYYGANSTGLYLLDGTTDDGDAIPFDVKTAMTDFKSPMRKTLASAYFSGRFGPASTITLTAGEGTPVAYSFSTPRGQNAQNHRQVFGKGMKERYFALEVAGTGTLELDGIEMDVAKLSRRI